jgi:hypothetical protein
LELDTYWLRLPTAAGRQQVQVVTDGHTRS